MAKVAAARKSKFPLWTAFSESFLFSGEKLLINPFGYNFYTVFFEKKNDFCEGLSNLFSQFLSLVVNFLNLLWFLRNFLLLLLYVIWEAFWFSLTFKGMPAVKP